MKFLWKNKFIFWNLVALIFVKAVFSYSGLQLASITGVSIFTKEDIVLQTNAFRSLLGVQNLKENPTLDRAASQKLQDMINGQYFAHTSPSGILPWHWFDTNDYKYVYAGENLAIGFLTAEGTVDAWENSPSHRQNLLNPNFKEIGVAVAPATIQNSEGFLVVQLFGTPQPTKTAVARPSPTPAPKTSPAGTPPAQSPKPSATVQSAEKSVSQEIPVSVPVMAATPNLNKVSKTLNGVFVLYALAIFLASVVLMMFVGARKELVIKTAASFALVVLAIAVPVLQMSRTALIL